MALQELLALLKDCQAPSYRFGKIATGPHTFCRAISFEIGAAAAVLDVLDHGGDAKSEVSNLGVDSLSVLEFDLSADHFHRKALFGR